MSQTAFKSVEIEEAGNKESKAANSKLFAVPGVRPSLGSQVTRRVTEVVDLQLAQGSMPA